jgi:two-component system OmpR family response regulator
MPEAHGALVYVVEDEPAVRDLVVAALQSYGFHTMAFGTGAAFLAQLAQQPPALCLVDLGLPDMDGIGLVREVARQCDCGLLILTGRSHPIDRVMGLELGADDYVVKPFEPRELVARVRSILRRRRAAPVAEPVAAPRRHAQFAGWRFDAASQLLTAPDGTAQALGVAEAQVLRVLLDKPRQVLTREQLMGSRDLPAQDHGVEVRISRLRRRLEAAPGGGRLIKNVYGLGYMLVCGVEWG